MFKRTLFMAALPCWLAAQSTSELLRCVPSEASSFEYCPHPKASAARMAPMERCFGKPGALGGVLSDEKWGISLGQQEAPVLVVTLPGAQPKTSDAVMVMGAGSAKRLLKQAKAKQKAGVWSWTVTTTVPDPNAPKKPKKVSTTRYAKMAGNLFAMSTSKPWLDKALKASAPTPYGNLVPWLEKQDASVVYPAATTATFFETMANQMEGAVKSAGPAAQNPANMMGIHLMTGFIKSLVPSVQHTVMGILFEPTGPSLSGKVFIKPDSSLAKQAAAMPKTAAPLTLLEGLTAAPCMMAMGIQGALVAPFLTSYGETLSKELQGKADPKDLAELAKAARATSENRSNMSFLVWPPTSDKGPFSNTIAWIKVNNAKDYLSRYQQMQTILTSAMGKMYPQAPKTTITPSQWNGLPTLETKVEIDPEGPEAVFIAGFFDSTTLTSTYCALDDNTIVNTFGDEEALKAAQAHLKNTPSSVATPLFKKTFSLLEGPSQAMVCLSPKECVGFVHAFIMNMMPLDKRKPCPAMEPCPPVGLHMAMTPEALVWQMVAPMETMQAVGDFVKKLENQSLH